jgi:hypothetical protein
MRSKMLAGNQGNRRRHLETEHWIPVASGLLDQAYAHQARRPVFTADSPHGRSRAIIDLYELSSTTAASENENTARNTETQIYTHERRDGTRFTYLLNEHFISPHTNEERLPTRNSVNPISLAVYGNCECGSELIDRPMQPPRAPAENGGRREMGTRFSRLFEEHFSVVIAGGENPTPPPLAIDVSLDNGNPALTLSQVREEVRCMSPTHLAPSGYHFETPTHPGRHTEAASTYPTDHVRA